jgi:FKBP-type peptidyl-prolyl cis-trans isomerase
MKVRWLMVVVVLLATGFAFAEEDTLLKTQKDKESYVVGLLVASDLKAQGMELNVEPLMRGLKDGLADAKPLLTEQEAVETMAAFRKALIAKKEEAAKQAAEDNKKQGETFLAENKKKEGVKTLPDGLQYKVIKEGTGPIPTADDQVTVHYKGTFIDGAEFDSSYKREEPAVLPVGGLIEGWKRALQLMKVGSKWEIFVPPELAYAEAGAGGVIPANATLVFEVELVSIVKEEKAKEEKAGETTGTEEKAKEEKPMEAK